MAGRPESPLDPSQGPVQQLAFELRKLREEAGRPTYREMARHTGLGATTLSSAAAGERLPSVRVTLAYVRACGGDPQEWEERWRAADLEAASLREAQDGSSSPYRGLERYEPADQGLFFGRDELVAQLAGHVAAHRLVAVVGASGSGKSSLLRAGLIPLLRTGAGGGERPRPAAIRILTPGSHPLSHAVVTLATGQDDGDTVVVIDQFEELFTLCDDSHERSAFLGLLLTALDPNNRLRVVLAVRADFFGRCAEDRRLADALRHATVLVAPMGPAELREVVVKPAAAAGLIVERELTSRIIEDAQDKPGGLPLMSHALLETWRRRKGQALTLAAYETAGGVQGAIARTAESVHRTLSDEQAVTARRILLRLVTPGQGAPDTGRPATRGELVIDCRAGERTRSLEVIERLAGARLITLDGETVTLAHEALLTAWPRLRNWIDGARDRMRLHRRLSADTVTWEELNRDPGALYRGSQLRAARAAFSDTDFRDGLTRRERSFLDASHEAGQRDRRHSARTAQRMRFLVISLSVVVVTALLGGPFLWQHTVISADNRLRDAAVEQALERARTLRDSDPQQAMQLAVASYAIADTDRTRSALADAWAQPEQDNFDLPYDATAAPPFLVRHGKTVLSVGADRVRTWDLSQPGSPVPRAPRAGGLAGFARGILAVSDDGSQAVTQAAGGALQLWEITSRRRSGRPFGSTTGTPAFDSSGRAIAFMSLGPSGARAELWSTTNPHLLFSLPAASAYARPVAVSGNGHYIAWCQDDGRPALWNVVDQRQVTLAGTGLGTECPRSVSAANPGPAPRFAPDGRSLALADEDGEIHRWNVDGRELPTLATMPGAGLTTDGATVVFSDDGRFLAVAGTGTATLWRLSNPGQPVAHLDLDGAVVLQPVLDLKQPALRFVTAAAGDGPPRSEWSVRTIDLGAAVSTLWKARGAAAVALTADGTQAVLPAGSTTARVTTAPAPGRRPMTRYVLDVEPPSPSAAGCSAAMSFSADGSRLAYTTSTRAGSHSPPDAIGIRNVRDGRLIETVSLPAGTVSAFALDASARRLAVLVADGHRRSITLYNLSGRPTPAGSGPWSMSAPNGARALAFRPDGGELIVAGDHHGAHAPTTFTSLAVSFGPDAASVWTESDATSTMTFSPDGRFLAVQNASGRLAVYDGQSQSLVTVLHRSNPAPAPGTDHAMAFSAQGNQLAAASPEGVLHLWDTTTWAQVGSTLPSTGDSTWALAFAPQGDKLRTQGPHTPLQTIDLNPAAMAKQVCARIGGVGLSPTQWRTDISSVPYHHTCGPLVF